MASAPSSSLPQLLTPSTDLAPFSVVEINGTQICPHNIFAFHDFSDDNLEKMPHLRYLRLDGNYLKPPIPLDLMMCFRMLQSVII